MSTIYCIGRNYINHAKELDNPIPEKPLVFLVSSTSLRGLEQAPVAFENETFHYEGEIALRIARDHKLGDKVDLSSIEALALGIDLTRRQEQSSLKVQGYPWTTSKSFLGSTIISDFIPVGEFHNEFDNIKYEFHLGGRLRQSGNTKDMLFSVEEICNYLNTFSPLRRGDLVLTGTPEGVGEIKVGENFSLGFPELGYLFKGVL